MAKSRLDAWMGNAAAVKSVFDQSPVTIPSEKAAYKYMKYPSYAWEYFVHRIEPNRGNVLLETLKGEFRTFKIDHIGLITDIVHNFRILPQYPEMRQRQESVHTRYWSIINGDLSLQTIADSQRYVVDKDGSVIARTGYFTASGRYSDCLVFIVPLDMVMDRMMDSVTKIKYDKGTKEVKSLEFRPDSTKRITGVVVRRTEMDTVRNKSIKLDEVWFFENDYYIDNKTRLRTPGFAATINKIKEYVDHCIATGPSERKFISESEVRKFCDQEQLRQEQLAIHQEQLLLDLYKEISARGPDTRLKATNRTHLGGSLLDESELMRLFQGERNAAIHAKTYVICIGNTPIRVRVTFDCTALKSFQNYRNAAGQIASKFTSTKNVKECPLNPVTELEKKMLSTNERYFTQSIQGVKIWKVLQEMVSNYFGSIEYRGVMMVWRRDLALDQYTIAASAGNIGIALTVESLETIDGTVWLR